MPYPVGIYLMYGTAQSLYYIGKMCDRVFLLLQSSKCIEYAAFYITMC